MKVDFCVGELLMQMCDNNVLKISGPSGKTYTDNCILELVGLQPMNIQNIKNLYLF